MSTKDQEPLDAPVGTSLDELNNRQIIESQTPKGLLYIVIASLALAVIVAFILNNHFTEKQAASESLGSASTIEELQAVADEHAGTASAGSALVGLSNRQINEGRYEEAIATIDAFLKDYNKHPLTDRGLLAKASAQLRLSRHDDAIATLDQFAAKYSASPFADLATILRGDIEKERGNREAAMAAYTIVTSSDAAGGSLAQLAKSRQDFVGYSAPREVEPAPKPEPELPLNGNLPPANTGDPELDAMINQALLESQSAPAETQPVTPEEKNPAEGDDAQPEKPEQTQPAEPQDTTPATPENANPAEPEDTQPATPQDAQTAAPEDAEPAE